MINPILNGRPTLRSTANPIAIDKLTAETAKIDLAQIIDFGDAPILDFKFDRLFQDKSGTKVDYPLTPIWSIPDKIAWATVNTGYYDYFEENGNNAIVFKNSLNRGQYSSKLSYYSGRFDDTKELFNCTDFEKIITAQIVNLDDRPCVAALVRDNAVYKVAFLDMKADETGKLVLNKKIFTDPFQDDTNDEVFKAVFKHQFSASEQKNNVISLVVGINMNTPRIVVKNFIFNDQFDPDIWNYTNR
jgi:hypothetical protein